MECHLYKTLEAVLPRLAFPATQLECLKAARDFIECHERITGDSGLFVVFLLQVFLHKMLEGQDAGLKIAVLVQCFPALDGLCKGKSIANTERGSTSH